RRVLGKWMHAGVMEDGVIHHPERGSPQGGVISPLVSNLYLHEVLDRWFEDTVKPRLRGRAFMVRFADDALLAFEREEDARRVLEVLAKRLARFGLTLHPEKTRLVDFRRPPWRRGTRRSQRGRSFDLLGFTHYWGRSRNGYWVVQRKTAKTRFRRAARQIGQWCRRHRHLSVAEQWRALKRKLKGHDAYYGITGNARALVRFRQVVRRLWRKWLNRRSYRLSLNWEAFQRLLQRYPLPPARVVHSNYVA
ncbi:group II intron reverse transcriptase/maturase, partial [Thiorhodococcus mannitoliphagus]